MNNSHIIIKFGNLIISVFVACLVITNPCCAAKYCSNQQIFISKCSQASNVPKDIKYVRLSYDKMMKPNNNGVLTVSHI